MSEEQVDHFVRAKLSQGWLARVLSPEPIAAPPEVGVRYGCVSVESVRNHVQRSSSDGECFVFGWWGLHFIIMELTESSVVVEVFLHMDQVKVILREVRSDQLCVRRFVARLAIALQDVGQASYVEAQDTESPGRDGGGVDSDPRQDQRRGGGFQECGGHRERVWSGLKAWLDGFRVESPKIKCAWLLYPGALIPSPIHHGGQVYLHKQSEATLISFPNGSAVS